jgi:predicted nucleotidyltransferase
VFEALLARLARALDAAGVPYMIIGGQAVLLYGEPRLTQDVDVTLGVAPDRLTDVLGVVEALGLRPLVEPEPFVAETLVLPCEEDETGLRVDLVFSLPGYERTAIERANAVEVGGAEVRFASVEDLLIHKLVAGRPRDLEDVRGVLLRQPGADLGYVRQWLGEFDAALGLGAEAALDRLLGEAE